MVTGLALAAPQSWQGVAADGYGRWADRELRAAQELDAALVRAAVEIARGEPELAARLAAIELPAAIPLGSADDAPPAVGAPLSEVARRDRANRARLQADLRRLEGPQLATAQTVAARLAELDGTVDPVTGARVPVQLIEYDPAAFGGDGAVVVSIGDLAAADYMGVMVPGMGTTAASIGTVAGGAVRLREAARRTDPSSRGAVIAWVGYDAPSGRTAFAEVATAAHAYRGAVKLRADLADIARMRPDGARTVLFGHSYGSTTAATAGARGALKDVVDAMVLYGSPGAGPVRNASELAMPGGVYAARDSADPVPPGAVAGRTWAGASGFPLGLSLGIDPASSQFGAISVPAEGPGDGLSAHSGYLTPGSPALAEFARILLGQSHVR